ncbi:MULTISPECIES: putative sulfate exporter family transporter [Ensifer]|uniref:YeiH family protein n=1 Tax=Ensifer TaxID=106591 RepID=UPI0009E9CD82|nr:MULTISPECIES: putative sulfate exporter family transporter [Ensifer]MDP9630145.1 putative integral membrane protein (TIGR00698 family) [Ensifer adhaerens]NOV21400.1 putative sulfate exporter family transporter [Ensifer canadensis]
MSRSHSPSAAPAPTLSSRIARIAPGLILCCLVALAAFGLERLEASWTGRPWLEALVIAILLGALLRTFWTPGDRWMAGIRFSSRLLLEAAIVLIGATLSFKAILASGPVLLATIVGIVFLSIVSGYLIARLLGLPKRMATLIACGNAICGNSAIAAVAPAIGAEGDDVAAAISFTAILGIAVVLSLPLIGGWFDMSPYGFGVLAGMTVYAVPQVLAAAAPFSALSVQVGTLVKLVRVLMLGPVVLCFSIINRASEAHPLAPNLPAGNRRVRLATFAYFVPWFILGFLAVAVARNSGMIPDAAAAGAAHLATWLTVIAMAALGLEVDIRKLADAGPRASAAAMLSLLVLAGLAAAAITVFGLG